MIKFHSISVSVNTINGYSNFFIIVKLPSVSSFPLLFYYCRLVLAILLAYFVPHFLPIVLVLGCFPSCPLCLIQSSISMMYSHLPLCHENSPNFHRLLAGTRHPPLTYVHFSYSLTAACSLEAMSQ